MKQLKLSLLAITALICPVVQADLKEQALRGATYAAFAASAWMIGETMRRSNNSAQEKLDKNNYQKAPQVVATYFNDFLRECGALGADEVQEFRMYTQMPPATVLFAADGVIYLNTLLVADILQCFENGDDLKKEASWLLMAVLHYRGIIVCNENPYNWGVWGAMAGTWCTLSGALAAVTVQNPTAPKATLAWLAVAPITIISAAAGFAWLQKNMRNAVRHADQYVIEHISDPEMLEEVAEHIFLNSSSKGSWEDEMPSRDERAATYRAAAEKLK